MFLDMSLQTGKWNILSISHELLKRNLEELMKHAGQDILKNNNTVLNPQTHGNNSSTYKDILAWWNIEGKYALNCEIRRNVKRRMSNTSLKWYNLRQPLFYISKL